MKKIIKRIVITVLVLGILAGGTAGGVWYLKERRAAQTVEVVPVRQIMSYYWGSQSTAEGQIVSDNVQELYPDGIRVVSEYFVSEGEQVAVGDPLLQFDKDSLELDVEFKEVALKEADLNLNNANKELQKLKNTTPSTAVQPDPILPGPATTPDPTPTPKPAIVYSRLDPSSVPYQGSGTPTDPYVYLCTSDCVTTPEFLLWLMGADIETEPEPTPEPELTPEPDPDIDVEPENNNFEDEEPSDDTDDPELPSDEPTAHEPRATILEVREGNTTAGLLLSSFRINGAQPQEFLPDAPIEPSGDDALTDIQTYAATRAAGNYNDFGYTAEQLKAMIAAQEQEVRSLELAKRQAELDLQQAKRQLENSTVYSTVDGTVKSLITMEEAASLNQPFLSVAGDSVYYVKGAISEALLGLVNPGDTVTVMDYMTGNSYFAQITEIADYPLDENSGYYYWGMGNPNSSSYEFTALILEPEGISTGQYHYVEVTFDVQETADGDALYVEKPYVRQDDGGYYVMKVSENNRLVKQYVQTGRTLYGYAMEIKTGLTEEDYLAFPYSQDAREGTRAVLQGSGEAPFGGDDSGGNTSPEIDGSYGGAVEVMVG